MTRENLRKRTYDIVNVLSESELLKVVRKTSYKGSLLKKDRTYQINDKVNVQQCIEHSYYERLKDLLKERIKSKKT